MQLQVLEIAYCYKRVDDYAYCVHNSTQRKPPQLVPEAQFQAQVFKLRQREYKYYAEAVNNTSTAVVPVLPADDSQPGLPAVPDLSDQGGLLNNALYFNFVLYILWKAALAYLPDEAARYAACGVHGSC